LLATAFLTALAPALAEGAPRALAAAWRDSARGLRTRQAFRDGAEEAADAEHLRAGDCVVVAAGETIPCDGEVLEGAATVDESALTGESAPVLREAAAPRARVVGGARVLSDRLKIRVDGAPGEGLLGRLAGRLEPSLGRMAGREAALAAAALVPAALILASGLRGAAAPDLPAALGAAAAAALILPTTLTALGGAAGSLGLRRLLRRGLLARDAAAVGAVARAQTLIVEESAAVSGRRRAVEFVAAPGIPDATLADAAQLASLIDESPEGRSIVALAKSKGLRGRRLADMTAGRFVLLPPHTGVSGCDDGELIYRKGPAAAIAGAVGGYSPELASAIDRVRRTGGEAVAVAVGGRAFGVVNMREPEGRGLRDVLGRLRAAGLRAVLAVRADSAASRALAVEVGADECAVAASPAAREALVEREKAAGRRTAAAGDAASDAALLAKCDAAFARGLRATPGAEAAVLDLAEDPIQAAAAVEDARAARRARAALDAAAWLCDAAKGAAAAALLLRLLNPGAPAGLFASAPSAALALGLTAFGLAPLLALTALALAGRL
jgi:K+-transporting ATPase ATPase B chain